MNKKGFVLYPVLIDGRQGWRFIYFDTWFEAREYFNWCLNNGDECLAWGRCAERSFNVVQFAGAMDKEEEIPF